MFAAMPHVGLIVVSAKADVEKPEYESESFRVLVFRKLHIQVWFVKIAGVSEKDQMENVSFLRIDPISGLEQKEMVSL